MNAIRALSRRWVELRLAGDPAGARRVLARFVARLGRAFSAIERDAFFRGIEAVLAEHRERVRQRGVRIDVLASEVSAANEAFDGRPTIIVARRCEILGDASSLSA